MEDINGYYPLLTVMQARFYGSFSSVPERYQLIVFRLSRHQVCNSDTFAPIFENTSAFETLNLLPWKKPFSS